MSFCRFCNHLQRRPLIGSGDDGDSRFNDAGLFKSNFGQRRPEPFLMVKLDIGDHARQWNDNVRCVQAATQARFPYNQVTLLLGEVAQSHDGDHFKERRMRTGRKRPEQGLNFTHQPGDLLFVNQMAVDLNPLAKRHPDAAR